MTPIDRGAPNIHSPELWVAFLAGILALLALDLYLWSRRHGEGLKAAIAWSAVWIVLSLAFGGYLWHRYGTEAGLEFFAGYLLEESLSVDNLFVFVLLFQSFAIPWEFQHRVLFWGVLGALVLRGTLILAGVALVHRFRWVLLIFGAVLVYTAIKIALHRDEEGRSPRDNPVVRFVRNRFPVTDTIEGPHFFVRRGGRRYATPLFLALIGAETADLVFALDSIPAVFAVTDDSFLVFSSNICALLGLRSLYFVVRGALARLRYLKPGLAVILMFVGLKMLLYRWVHIPTGLSLAVIAGILAVAVVVSWLRPPPPE